MEMFNEDSSQPVPLGLMKFSPTWMAIMAVLFLIFAVGVYAYSRQVLYGLLVTNMRTIGVGGSTWGLYVIFNVFFVGVSFAGITISATIRLFGISYLKPIARMAELMTIIILTMGAVAILADLGRPIHGIINFPLYSRPLSPFFGDFAMVAAGYLFSSMVFFYLSAREDAAYLATRATFPPLRMFYKIWAMGFQPRPEDFNRHANSSFWLSLFILPLLITAHSTLGFIFGLQSARPGWFTALQAPGFVVMAGISGTGFIMVIMALVRKFLNLQEVIVPKAFKWLGLLMMILCGVYIYFMVAEELTEHYAAPLIETRVAQQVTNGVYAPLFWITVGGLLISALIIFFQYLKGITNIGLHVFAGLLVNVSCILKRFIIIVPSQTFGTLLPYRHGFYHPSWVEVSIIAGLTALAIMVYMGFMKIFPIVPLNMHAHELPALQVKLGESHLSHLRRLTCFGITLILGLSLAVAGFLLSARFGTKAYLDPILPFSPILCVGGIMLCFIAAIVYEIVPEWKK